MPIEAVNKTNAGASASVITKLHTHMVEKPWGREDLPDIFGADNGQRIGEVWFDRAENPLPLLVKWLFTSERLSIQVHPNDRQAHDRGLISGKEECWVVTAAEPDARLGIGTLIAMSSEELAAAVATREIENLMDWKPVHAGDFFYIPAGTIHAIGAGVTLVEVQQNADVTYRLYDYGRPRELHLTDGLAVTRAEPYSDPRSGTIGTEDLQLLAQSEFFELWHSRGGRLPERMTNLSQTWLIPLQGSVDVEGVCGSAGDCLFVEGIPRISSTSDLEMLIAFNGGGA